MPLKSAIHLRLKEAGEFLHNNVKLMNFVLISSQLHYAIRHLVLRIKFIIYKIKI